MKWFAMMLTFAVLMAAGLESADASCKGGRGGGYRAPLVRPMYQQPVFQQPLRFPVVQQPPVRYDINWGGGLGWNGSSYRINPNRAAMDYSRRAFGGSYAYPGRF